MTREEAIKVLEKVKRVAEIYESEDVKAYNMAIELLKQEPCEKDWRFYFDHGYAQAKRDLSCEEAISREAVLSKIKEVCFSEEWLQFRVDKGSNGQRDSIIDYIEQLPPVVPQPKIGHCKECKYFEYDSIAKVDGIPLIVAHEICKKWGDGCKTKEDGYCFLFEPKESEDK